MTFVEIKTSLVRTEGGAEYDGMDMVIGADGIQALSVIRPLVVSEALAEASLDGPRPPGRSVYRFALSVE